MEAENDFTRKSKKYRTRYLDELGKLFGNVTMVNWPSKETILNEVNAHTASKTEDSL
jgi:hypothetical protein